ncbi:hypothetical protein BX666DRAFT_1891255 [Dichotomocladium elegans]|nr:hypothetical protein BX666DRAFT_1891255 [Dichotomocladium elegans]
MSCQTCAGCFTGKSCDDTNPPKSQKAGEAQYFYSLLEKASATINKSSLDNDLAQHDHTIPTIVGFLSNNVYASQVALFEAFNRIDLVDFLELSRRCYNHGVMGMLIAWAWEFCQGDAKTLLGILSSGSLPNDDSPRKLALWDHLDEQAEVYEVFNGLDRGSAGRVHRSEASI